MKKNKKLKLYSLIFLSLFVLFCQTIVYSAINATMTVRGDAYARAEADVRITDFRLATTNKATSSYEEFGKSHIVTEVDFLIDATSSITYYIEITNYGSADIGIFDINGLPSGVNYSIKDYNLHDKICDDTGKCNSFIKKTYEITLTTTSTYAGNVQLNFDFRTYHKVNYTDIENKGYPKEVIDGGTLKIPFQEDLKRVQLLYNNREILFYKTVANGQIITLSNITKDIEVKIKEQAAKLVNGDINVVGSEVCIGNECFYVISNDGSTVTLLSKYNLYVGNQCNDGKKPIALTNPTGKQDSTARGFVVNELPYIGTTNYSTSTQQGTTASAYNGSVAKNYVDSYSSYLTSQGVIINNSRLITIDELVSLGCNKSTQTCDSSKSWVYYTSYWTMSEYNSNHVWNVSSRNAIGYNGMDYAGYLFGVRPVIELDVEEIQPIIRVKKGNLDTVGSEICIGDECFYIISSDTDSVTMLAKYNLYVGNECTAASASTCTKYGENATGIQDSSMIGYKLGQDIRKGTSNFANTNYWGTTTSTYPSNVYNENSSLYSYIENYKNYLTTIGATSTVARIISYEELISLGCSGTDENCRSAPDWVYATSYWTNTAANSTNLWALNTYGNFYHTAYQYTGTFGCRPVIEIPKWLFADTIEVIINDKTYNAKEGMTWEEWVNSSYNKLNYYIDDTHICESDTIWLAYTNGGGTVNIASKVDPNETYYTYDFSVYWGQ